MNSQSPEYSLESKVKYYCREYPPIFEEALGALLFDNTGRQYIDFLSGCGALNYGHNNEFFCSALIQYIQSNGINLGLDLMTTAKAEFMENFSEIILKSRDLNYLMQFPGPTGTNAVEAAIKLARKVTGRTNIVAFTNAFHGCTLGALSLTASKHHRESSASILTHTIRMPFDGYFGSEFDTTLQLKKMLEDKSSGIDIPAAIILETIQGEGGLNVASKEWLNHLSKIANEHNILIIIDDIQAGCGRTGDFFSFDSLGIYPDMVLLSKSLSGAGLPLSMILLRPELDLWNPGEHNGTFRGNNHAFVTASETLTRYWACPEFYLELKNNENTIDNMISNISKKHDFKLKGRGLMRGIELPSGEDSIRVKKMCFDNGLIIETSGTEDNVLKLFPAININKKYLLEGLDILMHCIDFTFSQP